MVTWGEFKKEIDNMIGDDQKLCSIMMDFKSSLYGHAIHEEGFILTDQVRDIDSPIPFPQIDIIPGDTDVN